MCSRSGLAELRSPVVKVERVFDRFDASNNVYIHFIHVNKIKLPEMSPRILLRKSYLFTVTFTIVTHAYVAEPHPCLSVHTQLYHLLNLYTSSAVKLA